MNNAQYKYHQSPQVLPQGMVRIGRSDSWLWQSKSALRRMDTGGAAIYQIGQFVDVWLSDLANHNWLVCGSSGFGKTSVIRNLISQIACSATKVFALDVHGDLAVEHIADCKLGGDGMPSLKPLVPTKDDLAGQTLREYALYLVEVLFPRKLGVFQRSLFVDSLLSLYEAKGLSGGDDLGKSSEIPNIEFYELFQAFDQEVVRREQEMEGKTGKSAVLARERETKVTLKSYLQAFNASRVFNTEKRLELDELMAKSVVLNLTNVPDQVQGTVVKLLLDMVFRRLKLKGEHRGAEPRMMLVVDEASVLMDAERGGAKALGKAFAQQRKFGLGAIVATQNFSDFSNLGLLNNAGVMISLNNASEKEAQMIANETGFFKSHLVNQPFGVGSVKLSLKTNAAISHRTSFSVHGGLRK